MGTWIKDKVFANADEFIAWLDKEFGDYIAAHINEQHTHHTWKPNHSNYPKYTTLQLHQNMRNTHVNSNGWDDIAQHATIGKDGQIVLGRDIRSVPVSAKTHNGTTNWHPFAYEMIGNFDSGNDKLEGKQLESATKISRYFQKKNKPVMFHRELLLYGKVPKTCPGTGVDKTWFMNIVKGASLNVKPSIPVSSSHPLLKKGDKGDSVKELQTLLNKKGYKLVVDGIFGNGTDSALRDFQSKNGLVVDGVCGNATWDKLTYVAPVVQPKLNGFVKNEKSEWNYYVNGEMQKSRWLLDVGKYYWVNENGVMQTGWIKVDSKWYFLAKDGSMQVGWIEDNGKKYFFSADGSMKVGWMKEDDDSFYFANDGSLISGGWNCIEGKWFCFDADGELIEGTKLAANITVNADGSISKIENN
jgi:hypothetical protein